MPIDSDMVNSTAYVAITLGHPDELTEKSAEGFLREFLFDRRVLNIPFIPRFFISRMIAKRRAGKYLRNLRSTLIDGDMPLAYYESSLLKKFSERGVNNIFFAHRYGSGNIRKTVDKAIRSGFRNFVFLPLFPQCSSSMTLSARDKVKRLGIPKQCYRFINSYAADATYIDTISNCIIDAVEERADEGKPAFDALVLSFHSVPLSQLRESNYEEECEETFRRISRKVGGLFDMGCHLTYQSQIRGRGGKWLEPDLPECVRRLHSKNIESVLVVSPGFAFDCTETVVELGRDMRRRFMRKGKFFELISCLNDSERQIWLLEKLFEQAQL